ncbi:tyrosine-type recombinase/integrase [Roseateles sp. BYS78W]|uniref:Tyrosine-type recombinase/integrase n=1 Tax=Pelomonas candidula TaxID=3299025 RepID=A0ABW7HGG7_9BURK
MSKPLDFTIRAIEALPPAAPGTRDEYKDTKSQGLYLRVTDKGVKTFSFVGRPKGGSRAERETFGKFPLVKPEEARQRARELGGQLASGLSVTAARHARKGEPTVGELWDLYYAHIKVTNKAPEATKDLWDYYVAPAWARRRLSEVKALDVERWHRDLPAKIMQRRAEKAAERAAVAAARRAEIEARQAIRRHGPAPKPKQEVARKPAKPVTGHGSANKALELLRAMYFFAMTPKRALFAGPNPASGHEKFKQNDRERFLYPDEMRPFFEALAQEPNETMRDAILIALFTGQRRANVVAMRWDELHLDRAEWKLSGEFTKNGDAHTVPLTPEAVAILRHRREKSDLLVSARRTGKLAPNDPAHFVFSSDRSESGHITDFSSAWERLLKAAGLTNLVPHDLRRTNGSWLARSGASLLLIGKMLNHRTPEATQIYARLDLDPVRTSLKGATAAMFEAAGVKVAAEVIPLPKAGGSKKKSGGDTNAA